MRLSETAENFLQKLDKHIKNRIEERLKRLAVIPIPSDAKFIERTETGKVFRYRIGNFRALYIVKEIENIILIAKIDKRPRVYDQN